MIKTFEDKTLRKATYRTCSLKPVQYEYVFEHFGIEGRVEDLR